MKLLKDSKCFSWLNISNAIIILIILIICFPAFYYSLKTPFALIDDYGNWGIVKMVRDWSYFKGWLSNTFLSIKPGRYIPLFELYNLVVWSIFGPTPWLHHLSRWLLKILSFYFWYSTFLLFVLSEDKPVYTKTKQKNNNYLALLRVFNLPLLTLTILFFIFPNNPEARLAPQETLTGLFLAISNYVLASLLIKSQGKLSDISRKNLILIYIGFIGLALSKEGNVAFLLALLLIILIMQYFIRVDIISLNSSPPQIPEFRKGNKPNRLEKSKLISGIFWIRFIPLFIIFVYTVVRVAGAFRGGGYGIPTLTIDLFERNAKWLFKSILLVETQIIISIIFISLLCYRIWWLKRKVIVEKIQSSYNHIKLNLVRENIFIVCLLFEFIIYYGFLLTSRSMALRYWYPLIPLLVMIMVSSIRILWIKTPYQQVTTLGITLFLVYFTGANYANYLTQFVSQYNTRVVEKQLLDNLEQELISGATVIVPQNSEYETKIRNYFTSFLKYFYHRSYPIYTEVPPGTKGKVCYVTQAKGIFDLYREKTITGEEDYPLLDWSYKISSKLQGKSEPLIQIDSGADPVGKYTWYIYTNDIANLTDQVMRRDNLFDLYELMTSPYFLQMNNQTISMPIARRYYELFSQYTTNPGFPITTDLSLLGYYVRKLESDKYKIYMVFHITNPVSQDWKFILFASVNDAYVKYLPEYRRKEKSLHWIFIPDPPISKYKKNQFVIVTKEVVAAPIPYQLKLGLFFISGNKNIYNNRQTQLGTIDFKNGIEKFMVYIKLGSESNQVGIPNVSNNDLVHETLQNWQVSQGTRVFTSSTTKITDGNIIAVYRDGKKMKLVLNEFPKVPDEAGIFYFNTWINGHRVYINDGKYVPPKANYVIEYTKGSLFRSLK